MFLGLVFSFQQFKAPIPSDAVGEMDDQIAHSQIGKTINGAAELPGCRSSDLGAIEEFTAANDDPSGGRHTKSGMQYSERKGEPLCLGNSGRGENFAHPLAFRVGGTDDVDGLVGDARIQLAPDALDITGESFDGRKRQREALFVARRGNRLGSYDPKARTSLHQLLVREMFFRSLGSLQVMSGLFVQLDRFEQQQDTFRGKVGGQVVCGIGLRRERGDLNERFFPKTPLAGYRKLADRFDLLAKRFDADRVEQIGGKNIEQPAPKRKLARKFHGRCPMQADRIEPVHQFVQVDTITHVQSPGRCGELLLCRDSLQQTLHIGGDQTGSVGPLAAGECFEQPDPVAKHRVVYEPLSRIGFPGRKTVAEPVRKERPFVRQRVHAVGIATEYDNRFGRAGGECCRKKRAR